MALVSPGVEVTIIDESQYTSAGQNTIPYILIATAENKLDPAGTGIAQGTLAASTDNVYLITSQRELVNTFGNPTFYKTSGGNAIHGYELNEYGLMAAYSVLGATNRVYIQRANIDLAELEAALTRPQGKPLGGSYWMDLVESTYGIFEWSSTDNSFNAITPILITDTADLDIGGVPLTSIGQIDSYAIVTTNANNPIYWKNSSNAWVLVGSDEWKISIPSIIGTVSSPTLTNGDTIDVSVNGSGPDTITLSGTTLADLATSINTAGVSGLTAGVVNNRIELYLESPAAGVSADSSEDITFTIADNTGTILGDVGITAGTYYAPIMTAVSHTNIPRWRSTDTMPRPSGSIWIKTTAVNEGMNIVVKKYDSAQDLYNVQSTPVYANDQTANKNLDPAYGGRAIASGALYIDIDVYDNDTGTFKIMSRTAGETSITGTVVAPTLTIGNAFTIEVSQTNSDALTAPVTITMTGTTGADFVSDLLTAGVANIDASVDASGRVNITHTGGGVIRLLDTVGGPIAAIGITDALDNVRLDHAGNLILSNWNVLTYVADTVEPGLDPLDGTRWYYPEISDIDIMIHDGGAWKGYHNVTNDLRGFDLSLTDPAGPIVSPTAPETQSDGTVLVKGDLWIDTSDLENYPIIRRWEEVNTVMQWVLIDNADQTSASGILFADARWDLDGTTDPINDAMPLVTDMLVSDWLDPDAPNADLYPDGMLLWNTRRSGYNVKEFRINYFNSTDFDLTNWILAGGTETNSWVTVSGLRDDGSANFGRLAQRHLVVQALKSAMDTNSDIREEQRQYNLIACPGYPEIIPNMVALNNERRNTAFIVGDSPLRLSKDGASLEKWATNNFGNGLITNDGLVSNDEYLGVFYPSGRTTDLSGTSIVVPPSHMMLRTIIHSDEQSYPWLAPAGVRRGQIDNVDAIGYVDAATGEFKQMSTSEGVRDVLYTNNVNPISFVPGAGYVNYGDLTTKPGSALDRINVSRLISYIRGRANEIGYAFLFEPNDKLTRDEVKGQMERMLNDLIAKRGLYNYLVVCDESNNTPTRIDRNELWVDIAIEPVKDAEFIYVPIRVKNTGEI